MKLQEKLDAFKSDFNAGKPPYSVPQEVASTLWRGIAELVASGIAERALRVDDLAPSFVLEDPAGRPISLEELLDHGPVVVTFYRGVWCPFCNIEAQALQEALKSIHDVGGNLISISPQTKIHSQKSIRELGLKFPILMDPGNKVAAAFGIRFRVTDYIKDLYMKYNTDLHKFNDDDSWTLPLAARYVIAPDRKIVYADINADYTRSSEPSDMLPVLRENAAPGRTHV